MERHVYKTIELTGSSTVSIQDAVEHAITRANETLHNLRWFEVKDMRGDIREGAVVHWQVTVHVGFTLDDAPAEAWVDTRLSSAQPGASKDA